MSEQTKTAVDMQAGWQKLAQLPPQAQREIIDLINRMHLLYTAAEEKEQRPYGLAEGEFSVPEDFDAPLPEEIEQWSWTEEPLISMWQDRADMQDSAEWVRQIRKNESTCS